MSTFENTIDLLGDENALYAVMNGSISEFKDNILTTVGESSFHQCKNLKTVVLPKVTMINEYGFYECSNLETVDLTNIEYVSPSNAFSRCVNLSTLILRSQIVCDFDGSYILSKPGNYGCSKIASGNGYIYVPRNLVDSYKTVTNWSAYANQFRALEDHTVDGTITGELDTTKI